MTFRNSSTVLQFTRRPAIWLVGALLLGGCASHQVRTPEHPDTRPATTQPVSRAALPLDQIKPAPQMPRPHRSATAPAKPPVEALILYAKARDALNDGRRFSAITLLQQAIELDPNSFDLYITHAQARQGPGAGDKQVIEALSKAAALNPNNLQVQASLGRQFLAEGKLDQAVEHLRLARQTPQYQENGDDAAAVDLFLARALQQAGYTQAALDVYDRLLGRLEHPDNDLRGNRQLMLLVNRPDVIYMNVAHLRQERGQTLGALQAYEQAARHRPEDFEVNAAVVHAMLRADRQDQAMRTALELVSRFKGSPDSLQLLNQTYQAAGQEDRISEDLEQLSRQHPDDRGLTLALAGSLQDHGHTQAAEALLLQASRRNPDNLDLLTRLFGVYDKEGNISKAAALLIAYAADHPRRQEQLTPMWQRLLRPDRKDRLTLATLQQLKVPDSERAAWQYWIARVADMGQRSSIARQALQVAVKLSPPFAPAYEALMDVYWQRDDWSVDQKSQASVKLADLAEKNGDAALAASLRGSNLLRQDKLDDAAAAFEKSIRLKKDNPEAELALAVVRHRQGNNAAYEQALQKLVEAYPQEDDAWQALFQYYIQAQQPRRAVGVLGEWLKKNPDSDRAHLMQAGVYLRAGDADRAEKILLQMVDERPGRPLALTMLGQLYARSGQGEKYGTLLESLRSKHPANLVVLQQLVNASMERNKPQQAIQALDAARAVVSDPETLYFLAHLYFLAGQPQTTEQVLQQALKLDPDYAPANNDLGYTWADHDKNLPQAEKMIRQALKVDPHNTSYLDSLGWVLYKLGRFTEARESLQKAAVGQNPDPVVLNHLGDTLYRLGDKATASRLWEQSLKGIGRMPEPRDELKQLRVNLQRKLMQIRQDQPADVAPSVADRATRT